jgi:hypothetical protein
MEKAEKVNIELKLADLAKTADDIANWLKVHPADDYLKAAALLFLFVISQANLPPPTVATRIFQRTMAAIDDIITDEASQFAASKEATQLKLVEKGDEAKA